MKIIYTKHALGKFKSLAKLNWKFIKSNITAAIKNPDHYSEDKERNVLIVLKSVDANHYLRVIYTKRNDIIKVVTFYPTEKGRYENS